MAPLTWRVSQSVARSMKIFLPHSTLLDDLYEEIGIPDCALLIKQVDRLKLGRRLWTATENELAPGGQLALGK
jgi:hypothetical protein